VGIACSIYAVECGNSYDRNGCDELSFKLGSKMSVNQYQVIYDGDQDGVRDSMDKCLDTPYEYRTKVNSEGCHTVVEVVPEEVVQEVVAVEEPVAPVEPEVVKVITIKVNFRTAKYDILEKYETVVEEFAIFLIEHPDYNAKIVGHTDSRSKHTDNMLLSLNRAKAVRNMLIDLGIDSDRLSVDVVGPNEPIATNSTRAGRAQNRRIEATITKGDR